MCTARKGDLYEIGLAQSCPSTTQIAADPTSQCGICRVSVRRRPKVLQSNSSFNKNMNTTLIRTTNSVLTVWSDGGFTRLSYFVYGVTSDEKRPTNAETTETVRNFILVEKPFRGHITRIEKRIQVFGPSHMHGTESVRSEGHAQHGPETIV